jgi:hypothetical protein
MKKSTLVNVPEADSRDGLSRLEPLRWGILRMSFILTVGLCLGTVVAGLPAAPLISRWMFDDWRFWKHLRRGLRLYPYGYRMLGLMLRGHGSFLLGVPLFSPPRSKPAPNVAMLREDWAYGGSCGPCTRCCRHGRGGVCPLLDEAGTGSCVGYDSFFWRYFNCGRFPSRQWDVDYYACPKWLVLRSDCRSDGSAGHFPLPPGSRG